MAASAAEPKSTRGSPTPLEGFSEASRKFYAYDPIKRAIVRVVPRDVARNFKNVTLAGLTIDEQMEGELPPTDLGEPHVVPGEPLHHIDRTKPQASQILTESELDKVQNFIPDKLTPTARARHHRSRGPHHTHRFKSKSKPSLHLKPKYKPKAKSEDKRRLRHARKEKGVKTPLERRRAKESRAKLKKKLYLKRDRFTKYDTQGRNEESSVYDDHYNEYHELFEDDPYDYLEQYTVFSYDDRFETMSMRSFDSVPSW